MNIPYASPINKSTVDGENAATHIANIRQSLLDAEWDELSVTYSGTFTLPPSNGETVTVGAKTYTFLTTLGGGGNPNEVLISGSASACAENLAHAINDDSGEGTLYGNGTTANADATATVAGAVITIHPSASTSIAVAEGLSNFTWEFTATTTGFLLRSRSDHPCKYRYLVWLYQTSSTQPRYRVMLEDRTRFVDEGNYLTCDVGRTFFCRATPYDFWIVQPTSENYFYSGALYNPTEWGPLTITTITKGNPTRLQITAHGMSNGQSVTLSQLAGDSNWLAQNGKAFSVTVVDANNIDINLDSSTFADPTGTPKGYAGNSESMALSVVMSASLGQSTSSDSPTSWRLGLVHATGSVVRSAGRYWWAFNQHTVNAGSPAAQPPGAMGVANVFGCWGVHGTRIGLSIGRARVPAVLQHGVDSVNSTGRIVGALWNAVAEIRETAIESDLAQIPLDGRFFYNLRVGAVAPFYGMHGAILIEEPAEP